MNVKKRHTRFIFIYHAISHSQPSDFSWFPFGQLPSQEHQISFVRSLLQFSKVTSAKNSCSRPYSRGLVAHRTFRAPSSSSVDFIRSKLDSYIKSFILLGDFLPRTILLHQDEIILHFTTQSLLVQSQLVKPTSSRGLHSCPLY